MLTMTITSKEFEDNLIKTVIGVVVLVVGASLIATAGNLMFRAAYNAVYAIPGVLVFIVGAILLYYAVRIMVSLLRTLGLDMENK